MSAVVVVRSLTAKIMELGWTPKQIWKKQSMTSYLRHKWPAVCGALLCPPMWAVLLGDSLTWGPRLYAVHLLLTNIAIRCHASGTRSSQVVSHPSILAYCCLTSVFELKLVSLSKMAGLLPRGSWHLNSGISAQNYSLDHLGTLMKDCMSSLWKLTLIDLFANLTFN